MNAAVRFAMAAAWAAAAAACAPIVVEVPPAAFDLPAPLATSQTTMPIDAIRVAAAIVDRLSGGTGAAAGVTFADDAAAAVGGGEALAGFDWRDTTLIQYVEGDAAQGILSDASLHLVDSVFNAAVNSEGQRVARAFDCFDHLVELVVGVANHV